MIAYWVPEVDQIPAKVTLIEIPSRKEIRTKNLFLVQDVRTYVRGYQVCFLMEYLLCASWYVNFMGNNRATLKLCRLCSVI